ncbi:hypothetical protein XELAEV_18025896mg [Xenopus laevis]|uniref:Uncharacterized protein n=1 Tax=Xenopus laevis TaxID=8355 RepID=A0A974HMQ1_XENLA|nr:hypothetical protein XELAEV_18025896mg [Xenopus laevis]
MAAILRMGARVAGQRRRRMQRALQLQLQRASEGSSMSDSDQSSFRSTSAMMPLGMLKDTSRRYTWGGVFAQKVSDSGNSVMVPVCGRCRREAYPAFHDVRGRCPHCQQSCWIGPYVDDKVQGSPQAVLGLLALMANEERYFTEGASQSESTDPEAVNPHRELAVRAALLTITDRPAEETPLEGSTPHVPAVTEASVPPETAPVLPAAVESVMAPVESKPEKGPEQEIHSRGSQEAEDATREERRPPSRRSNRPEGVSANIPSRGPQEPPVREGPPPYPEADSKEGWARKGADLPSRGVTQGASSGKEGTVDEAEDDGATDRPLFKLPHSFWAPKKITRAEEKHFWVVPGRANPEIFCRVSRVQRVINFRVYRKWGYYMPYAPLWVYEQVEENLDEWVVEEIVAKEKTIGNTLSHPDQARRAAAWSFVRSLENEWWWGHTILRHAVHSFGKKNPAPRYFSVDVPLPEGGTVEKPHPKYYISYEDTKMRFTYMI